MVPNEQLMSGANDDAAAGGGCNGKNRKRFLASLSAPLDAPGHEVSVAEINGGNNGDGEEEEAARGQPRPTQVKAYERVWSCKRRRPWHANGAWYAGGSPHLFPRAWPRVDDPPGAWWRLRDSRYYPEAAFRRDFRMGRDTFAMICTALDSTVAKEGTVVVPIPVRQRVAVCVRRLVTGEPLRVIADQFGICGSTCHKLVLEVCAAICSVLRPRFLRWPAGQLAAAVEATSGVPGVAGAIYTTHIPIIAPKLQPEDYYNPRLTKRNKKPSYSISIQGVVGSDGTFADVSVGWPGSMLDDQILASSDLHRGDGVAAMGDGSWLVGGTSYPLTDWLLVPYTHENLTLTQRTFNEMVADLRGVSIGAFTKLKRRWGFLQKRTEMKLHDLRGLLGACCVLHNVCETAGEEMEPELSSYELDDDETVLEDPVISGEASIARDKIARNLLRCYLAGTTS